MPCLLEPGVVDHRRLEGLGGIAEVGDEGGLAADHGWLAVMEGVGAATLRARRLRPASPRTRRAVQSNRILIDDRSFQGFALSQLPSDGLRFSSISRCCASTGWHSRACGGGLRALFDLAARRGHEAQAVAARDGGRRCRRFDVAPAWRAGAVAGSVRLAGLRAVAGQRRAPALVGEAWPPTAAPAPPGISASARAGHPA